MRTALFCLLLIGQMLSAHGQDRLRDIARENDTVIVVVFLAVDCPISQKYIPTLNEIADRFAESHVAFHGFIPGKTRKKDIKQFVGDYAIGFPVLGDRRFEWAKSLSAEVTPEVFVFDSNLKLKYRGAIDNWFYELGGYRKEPTDHYLVDSIRALLQHRDPELDKTKALGCVIQLPS